MRRGTIETLNQFSLPLTSLGLPVSSLSGGQRQSVAVVRAVAYAKTVVFMDEPTAALGVKQRGLVLDLIRRIRDQGISVGPRQPQHAGGASGCGSRRGAAAGRTGRAGCEPQTLAR